MFQSNFSVPKVIEEQILRNGQILSDGETPAQMIERIVQMLYQEELVFSSEVLSRRFADSTGYLLDSKHILFSTPIMTNAGCSLLRPLSACTVPPIDLRGDLSVVKKMVDVYHQEAMGTGFNFDDVENITDTLLFLNSVAVTGASSGLEDRPVGNMGVCSIDHPQIVNFIRIKRDNPDIPWKFNLSVHVPPEFWNSLEKGDMWTLKDGSQVSAIELFDLIVECAYLCADPGLIFLDRLNRDNPVPAMGTYTSTAPCAEVGLLPGETCQFGYLNLGAFVQDGDVDIVAIANATELLTRALDNCLEVSIRSFGINQSRLMMQMRRKIGIGICGLADLFIKLQIPYDSERARQLAKDIVMFVNFKSKLASHKLSIERGPFGAMKFVLGNKYLETPGFLSTKYGGHETRWVSSQDWYDLENLIRKTKHLRHCSTIALPPTGRSGLIIGASTGVEPHFTLYDFEENLIGVVKEVYGPSPNFCNPQVSRVLNTSTSISAIDHLLMVSRLQPAVDESISKTINLPHDASMQDISDIYKMAYKEGLKGITIYRDGSVSQQPKKL